MKEFKFPDNFYWGAAISSYQTEGGNTLSDWGDRAGKACDFWNRYEYYLDIAKSLKFNAFRLSLEWSRINPREDEWDEKALEHYADIIRAVRARGMEPFVTLWHFTLPQWISQKGGWLNPDTIKWFLEYTQKACGAFGSDVRFWILINEPSNLLYHSYVDGQWPPFEKNAFGAYLHGRKNLERAVKKTCQLIRSTSPGAQISAAFNIGADEPYRANNPGDRLAVWGSRKFGDYGFLQEVCGDLSFIALNYYFHNRIKFTPQLNNLRSLVQIKNENKKVSDLGWELYPEGIETLTTTLWQTFKKPIYITESGLADKNDRHRPWFIAETISSIGRAMQAGADIRSYLHWSLIDNFEWEHGFEPRFGLCEMDYEKMTATPRPSTHLYRSIIENKGLIETS